MRTRVSSGEHCAVKWTTCPVFSKPKCLTLRKFWGWVWWHKIPAEGDRGRGNSDFEASLVYVVSENDNNKEHSGANKLTKGRKAPTTNPDSMNLIHRNPVVEGESWLLQIIFWPPHVLYTSVEMHTCTHTHSLLKSYSSCMGLVLGVKC